MTDKILDTTQTMTAWQQTQYGGPEVLRAEQVPVPAPGRGEVLLKIGTTALNAADVRLLRGTPLLMRLAFGLRRPRPAGRGMDAAGTVVAVGEEVIGLAVGDEVVGEFPGGALAEYAVAPAERLVHLPEGMDPATAAALPLAGGTAWQALDRSGVGSDLVVRPSRARHRCVGRSGYLHRAAGRAAGRRGVGALR